MDIKGSDIVKRIDILLKEKGETRKALVSIGAIKTIASVTNWLQRGTIPSADVALIIADYFNVSVRWLITGKDNQGYSHKEVTLLSKFAYLTEDNQRNVLALIDSMLSVPDQKANESVRHSTPMAG